MVELLSIPCRRHPTSTVSPVENSHPAQKRPYFSKILIMFSSPFSIISAIDNLIKGASGQAVQNMNIAFKLKETMGLI